MTTGDVEIDILDNGAGTVVVPAASVAVVIGTCASGDVATVRASRDPNRLLASAGAGPGVDLSSLLIASGGTALFMKAQTQTPGVASAVDSNLGSAVMTVTGEPFDAYLVRVRVTKAGTVGTAGARIRISCDAGRTEGPEIALGIADTYAMVGTGLTLNFASGDLTLGGTATFGCAAPLSDVGSVVACLNALDESPYSNVGWGSIVVDGSWDAADMATIHETLEELRARKTFTRAICPMRDVGLPEEYGGDGEVEEDWTDELTLDVSELSATRISPSAGHYNITSKFPIACAGLPRMRRPGAWAYAARQVAIPPQRHAGRVSDKSLAPIIVDPVNDPNDGFVYHNERTNPVFDVARVTGFRTRKGKGGYFIVNPKLASPQGSVFTLLPLGNVMDIGCDLLNQTSEDNINADVLLNRNGTIDEKEAQKIEKVANGVLRDQMFAKSMISGFNYTIDRSQNVRATSIVKWSATLFSRGYILEIDGQIGFGNDDGTGG